MLAVDKTRDAVEETARADRRRGRQGRRDGGRRRQRGRGRGLVARAIAEFGGLDVVYANAGISGGLVPLFEQTVEHWQEILRVNLIGPFLAIKHAGAHMVKQGARLDRLHRVGGRAARERRRQPLQREQGRRDQPGADRGQFVLRHRRARQRDLSRA